MNNMKFYHKAEPAFIYNLRETGSNFIATWTEEGSEKAYKFTQEEVEDNLSDGTWVEIEE